MKTLLKRLKLAQLAFISLAMVAIFGCEPEEGITPQLQDAGSVANRGRSETQGVLRVPEEYATIQLAVAAAKAGDHIHVSEGTYHHTVNIIGAEKNNLQILAVGKPGSVTIVGHHDFALDGGGAAFYLKDVSGVVIRGFVTRDFGYGPESAMGESFLLENAHNNRIEHNSMTASDMMGVTLWESANNRIAHNKIFLNDPDVAGRTGLGCGIHIQGSMAANNLIHNNEIWGNPFAGVMIRVAGAGNVIRENIIRDGSLWGVTNHETNGTKIVGNQIYGHQGLTVEKTLAPWFPPSLLGPGYGIDIQGSTGVEVMNNKLYNNKTADIYWDGSNENSFMKNTCGGGGFCNL